MTDRHLILFARSPEFGKVKSRISGKSNPELAFRVYTFLLKKSLETIKGIESIHKSVYFLGDPKAFENFDLTGLELVPQRGKDLGSRMFWALDHSRSSGFRSTVLVGADCPDLSPKIIRNAFDALQKHQMVFGPAEDGGYYLVGSTRPEPEVFGGIPWGTSAVLAETLEILDQRGIPYDLVEKLRDVDTLEDARLVPGLADLLPEKLLT